MSRWDILGGYSIRLDQ